MSGSLVLGTVGAVVGGFFGGPMGAKIGYALGSMAGSSMDNQGKIISTQGPRLNDLKVQANTYGISIPKVWGTVELAGNVIWATDIEEIAHTESQGGKGGAPKQENTQFTYQANFAVAICEAGISDVLKIYANELLIYDASEGNTGKVGDIKYNMRIYKGGDTQQPDPLIQQDKGVYAPAYRDLSYVVFEDLELEKFGGQIPNLKFVVVKTETDTESKIITEVSYSYETQADSNLNISDIAVNPVNKFIYVLRCTSENPSASVYPLQIDIINPYTKALTKQKKYKVSLVNGGTTTNTIQKQIKFDTLGNLILNCAIYYNETTSSLDYPATYNTMLIQINKDTLNATRLQSTVNSLPTTSNFPNGGAPHVINNKNKFYHLALQNIASNYTSIGLWTFDLHTCSAADISLLTTYVPSNAYLVYDIDFNKGDVYFVTYEDATRTIAYLNKLSYGYLNEKILTLYSGVSAFGLSDVYFDKVARKIFISYFEGDYGVSTPMTIIKIDADTLVTQTLTWGNILSTGFPLKRFRVDENNRRFISKVRFTSGSLNYFTYINMDYFTVENIAFDNSTIPNTEIYQDCPSTAYHKDIDADFWIGTHNTTTNTSYVVCNSGKRVKIGGYSLQNILDEVTAQTGIDSSLIDTTDLSAITVKGYVQTQNFTARGLIEPIAQAFSFDCVETNNKLTFKRRGDTFYTTIDEGELSAALDKAEEKTIEIARTQELELPKKLNVNYLDFDKAFMQNTQQSLRTVDTTENQQTIELPIVFDADEAKQIADKLLFSMWANRDSFSFSTNYDYINIEPNDLVKIKNYLIRITSKEESQGVIKFKGVSELPTVYTQHSKGATGEIDNQEIDNKASTNLILLDIPMLTNTDNDYGLYTVVNKNYGTSWNGCSIYTSVDGVQYRNVDTATKQSISGSLIDSLLPNYTGNNTLNIGYSVRVEIVDGVLSSCTDAELENGKNLCLIGSELVQFKEATLVSTNTYDLFGFLRGRFGTEAYQSSHEMGEQFVLLEFNSGKIKRIETDNIALNLTKNFKAVTFGSYLDDAYAIEQINTCQALKPYAVFNAKVNNIANTSLTVTWNHRIRGIGVLRDYTDVTDEDGINFIVECYYTTGDILIGTYEVITNSFYYSNTLFQADLVRNGIATATISASNVKFKIYKVNSKYGRSDAVTLNYSSLNI